MKKQKCPYTFPDKSRVAITNYLISHTDYGGWNHPYRGWSPLAWNVKVDHIDWTGGRRLKYHQPIDPLLDDEWAEHAKRDESSLYDIIIEDARRTYDEGLYTTYPGDDQGDWKFCFGGRSGGWLILEGWKNDDFLKMAHKECWEPYLDGLFYSDLITLYKGVRCMDQDFTREKARMEVSYQLNFQRILWEEGIREQANLDRNNLILIP